jgi:hypothetical protein
VADKSSTSSSSTVGLATAANGLDFNYSASDYKVVASNDDGLVNAPGGAAFMSQLEFTVSQTGYHYFYVSKWNGGGPSTTYDSTVGYSSTGGDPATSIDSNGSFLDAGDPGRTPTGSVAGGFPLVGETSAFYLMHRSGETPTPPSAPSDGGVVPEPSSLAIFSVLGIAAFSRTRRSKKSASNEI